MTGWSQALAAHPESAADTPTFTGNRGLQFEEKLIFEQDSPGHCGVDLPEPRAHKSRLGGMERMAPIGLPGLSEPQVVRHFTRLSQKNYAIDSGLYPLGSCTMKHNPRLNEKLARLPGFADLHPLQPETTIQGALELIETLAHWLRTLTGMPAVALSPAAGAHGELCGIMTIRAAL
jgi:glycine dehydrogenase subunit 2